MIDRPVDEMLPPTPPAKTIMAPPVQDRRCPEDFIGFCCWPVSHRPTGARPVEA